MKHEGVLPREETLLAACELYNMVIVVLHGMKSPVVFRHPEDIQRLISSICSAFQEFISTRWVAGKSMIFMGFKRKIRLNQKMKL